MTDDKRDDSQRLSCSLGQKIADKFTKLNKTCFSMEYFTTGFSRIFNTNIKICLLGGWLGTRHQIQAFQGFS